MCDVVSHGVLCTPLPRPRPSDAGPPVMWGHSRASPHARHHSLLQLAELDSDDELALRRDVLQDVRLEPAQQVRAEHVVQLLDLVLLRDVGKLLEETRQVTATRAAHVGVSLRLYSSTHRGLSEALQQHTSGSV